MNPIQLRVGNFMPTTKEYSAFRSLSEEVYIHNLQKDKDMVSIVEFVLQFLIYPYSID